MMADLKGRADGPGLMLTARAWWLLAGATVRLRRGPFDPRMLESAAVPDPAAGTTVAPASVDAAVRRAARLVPGARCLASAIAARQMLRPWGDAQIRYAVVREGAGLLAHAWVEIEGRRVAGDPPVSGAVVLESRGG